MPDENRKDDELTPEEQEQEANDAFSAGFNRIRQDLDPTLDLDDIEPKEEEEEPKEEEPTPEELAAEQRQKQRDQMLDKLPDRMRSLEGQIGGMKQKLDGAIEDMAKATANAKPTEDTPSTEDIHAALADDDALKDMIEDYPAFKTVLENLKVMSQSIGEMNTNMQALQQAGAGASEDLEEPEPTGSDREPPASEPAVDEAAELAALKDKYPDYETTAASKEFMEFALDSGPPETAYGQLMAHFDAQNIDAAVAILDVWKAQYPDWWKERGEDLFTGTAAASIRLLDGFKSFEENREEYRKRQRQDRLKRADTPAGQGGDSVTTVNDEQAFASGFNKVMKNSGMAQNNRRGPSVNA